ncbi:MAG: hypothetical protein ACE14P_01790 [Methanotrichaceae archaeon]
MKKITAANVVVAVMAGLLLPDASAMDNAANLKDVLEKVQIYDAQGELMSTYPALFYQLIGSIMKIPP